jgi:hypothetical protein
VTAVHVVTPGQIYESPHARARIRVITVHHDPALWGTALVEPLTGRHTGRRIMPVRLLNPPSARTGWRLIAPQGAA